MVRVLLEAGANPEGDSNEAPLSIAASRGNSECVDLLLAFGANPCRNRSLAAACRQFHPTVGHERVIAALLNAGGVADGTGGDGIIEAVTFDFRSAVTMLLCAGVAVEAIDSFGMSALSLAARIASDHIVELCIAAGGDLDDAIAKGEAAPVDRLLTLGATVVTADMKKLLLEAVKKRDVDMVQVLLKHGADPNTTNDKGHTVLGTACTRRNADLFEAIVDAGANLDAPLETLDGLTPLAHLAKFAPNLTNARMLKALVAAGADDVAFCRTESRFAWERPSRTIIQYSAFLEASTKAYFGVLRILLPNSAIGNSDSTGLTALHNVCRNGRADAVRFLLRSGAEPSCCSAGGEEPYRIARRLRKVDTEAMMAEAVLDECV